ncbi:urea transport system permease protein [Cupriavidus metallidurans]|jgi:urea transport system permease protein|uniref:urea ABC transporter permease subunit UrtC n=1 Tax=Cupriavidus TaxID=106589 RepID=UPI000492FA2E|nr:urea ABC transporter permease subunit UrtC [Cupriavidus metallidurans]MDE4917327.1 urea ABC transporter permease subunit UrtC [Cupriavidus metallidurans]
MSSFSSKSGKSFTLSVPERQPLFSTRMWMAMAVLTVVVAIGVPVCALVVPEGHALHLSAYALTLIGKIMCFALAAIALDLVWGYCGILSLGHGLFFALGGYAMGMYLMRSIGREGVYKSDLPDFMVFLDWKELPWFWHGTEHFPYALLLVVLVPGVLAWLFGFFAFRSRIKGVYLSIITQAMTYAAMLLFFRNETGFGGNNGFTDFKRIAGFAVAAPQTRAALFVLTFLALLAGFVACRYIVTSKLGRVVTAVRDAEMRVMFSGYNPLGYKLFVWTFSAVLCGIAGALYVPQVGIINPSEMSPANSIEMAVWVAVGGRGTLIGPVVGAFLVNGAKTMFTAYFAEYWLFLLGAMFVLVTLYLPDGVVGLWRRLRDRRTSKVETGAADEAEAVVAPRQAQQGSKA